ncbi:antitoxin Xre/MbcA/ParS-like domain-containing protein [Mesorhizobium sp. BHbdii]
MHGWHRGGEVIALRKGGRKHALPVAQCVEGRTGPGNTGAVSWRIVRNSAEKVLLQK